MSMTAPPTERGFTLIEMLVALAVFAIAAMALMRLDIYAITQTASLAETRLASLVAHNEAALALTDPAVVVGETRSSVRNGGADFDLARRVTPTADARLVRIDIAAVQRNGRGRSVVTLVKRVS
ncbi:MAG: type II secretion system minor pseudopilin GspI [Sphingomonas bacterium]|nr:type II secretion system minor pseudopilin GspI [Sphingomonas bacterium]